MDHAGIYVFQVDQAIRTCARTIPVQDNHFSMPAVKPDRGISQYLLARIGKLVSNSEVAETGQKMTQRFLPSFFYFMAP
jgi:hypothetical protein